jgi:hypothetical protein
MPAAIEARWSMLGQSVFDAILNRLVAGIPRHFLKSSLFFHFGSAVSGSLLHSGFIGVRPPLWRMWM